MEHMIMKSSMLVSAITRTVIATGLSLFATMASAYTVVNNTGVPAHFSGQFCGSCMKINIPAGASRSCPADKSGCGGQTWVYAYQGRFPSEKIGGALGNYCYATPTQKINSTDTIVFSRDGWEIFNSSGVKYASGQYDYWQSRAYWEKMNSCPGYFQEG